MGAPPTPPSYVCRRPQGKRTKALGKKDPGVPQLGRFATHLQQQSENKQKRVKSAKKKGALGVSPRIFGQPPHAASPQAAEAKRRREAAREAALGQRRSLDGMREDALRRLRDFERKVGDTPPFGLGGLPFGLGGLPK